MTTTTHTTGPWALGGPDCFSQLIVVAPGPRGCDEVVCRMPREYRRQDKVWSLCSANANLIAAAPELLDALRLALAYIRHREPNAPQTGMLDQMESAIAKAEGR